MVNQMQLFAPATITQEARLIINEIIVAYGAPPETFKEILDKGDSFDPLAEFSKRCRQDLEAWV